MKIVTSEIQDNLKVISDHFLLILNECHDLENLYNKGSVASDIAGLASDSDPAAQSAKLKKSDVLNGEKLVRNLVNILDGQVMEMADYNQIIQNLKHGQSILPSVISSDLEDFSTRVVQVANDLLVQYNRCRDVLNFYKSTEIELVAGVISDSTIVFGSEMTKKDLVLMMDLVKDYIDYIENQTVTQFDYKTTLSRWSKF